MFENYVKKALDEADFNVVSSPSKYSIIVEFYPGNLIALYFDNDKSKIIVRNELFMSLSQNENTIPII